MKKCYGYEAGANWFSRAKSWVSTTAHNAVEIVRDNKGVEILIRRSNLKRRSVMIGL